MHTVRGMVLCMGGLHSHAPSHAQASPLRARPCSPATTVDQRRLQMYTCTGIPIDGKTVFTSDHALKMDWLPNWVAIIGSGYIGLEFSDVYTALGTEVTFIEVCARVRLEGGGVRGGG